MAIETQAEQLAQVSCSECDCDWRAGELWRVYFADIGEVAIYCPECGEREFDDR